MIDNQLPNGTVHTEPDVAAQNMERLLEKAYKPEAPDADFAQRLRDRLAEAARDRAQTLPMPRTSRFRRRAVIMLAVAAVVAGLALLLQLLTAPPASTPDTKSIADQENPKKDGADRSNGSDRSDRPNRNEQAELLHLPSVEYGPGAPQLTARERPAPPKDVRKLALGGSLRTKGGERERVVLPDGSVLYLNQNTEVKLDADRRITLSAGEVFVEVAPRSAEEGEAARFIVKTPKREVVALGTKFDVSALEVGTGVTVTQGKVRVSDLDDVLTAGQQIAPDAKKPTAAPRAAAALAWTRELMCAAESPLVPPTKYEVGAIVVNDPTGQQSLLQLRKYHIDVHIEDGFARTTIDQTYFNPNNMRLEGTFHFPLPADASLSRLAMYVNGTRNEGGMAERDFARQTFNSIVRRMQDPALLEWVDGTTFQMRVFPLEARQEKRIIMSYTQRLPAQYGRMSYRFPGGHSLEAVRDWSINVRVKGGKDLTWASDTHPEELKATTEPTDLLLEAKEENVKQFRDVAIDLFDGGKQLRGDESARFSSMDHESFRYFMVRYRPELPVTKDRRHRDWVFLFESSGDRDPLLARTQIEVIRTLLANVEHDDTFAIVTAATRAESFAKEAKPATPENITAALKYLEETHLVGVLDLGKGLTAAEPFLKTAENPYLVHIGSGLSVLGETKADVLAKRISDGIHYVGVGVGKRWNRALMKQAAERTGGYFTQINPDEPVNWRTFELYSTLTASRLLDVKVVDNAEKATFLSHTTAVVQGEEICAITQLPAGTKLPESVTVTGTLDGKTFTKSVPVKNVAVNAGYLPRTWARLEIDRLLAENAQANKAKIVQLSLASYVMTPYTSLLVLENDQMYAQYGVDRGRKDHWAMYNCPDTIPVVVEPIEGQPIVKPAPVVKPTTEQVLATILYRVPPRAFGDANAGGEVRAITVRDLYAGSFGVPVGEVLDGIGKDKAYQILKEASDEKPRAHFDMPLPDVVPKEGPPIDPKSPVVVPVTALPPASVPVSGSGSSGPVPPMTAPGGYSGPIQYAPSWTVPAAGGFATKPPSGGGLGGFGGGLGGMGGGLGGFGGNFSGGSFVGNGSSAFSGGGGSSFSGSAGYGVSGGLPGGARTYSGPAFVGGTPGGSTASTGTQNTTARTANPYNLYLPYYTQPTWDNGYLRRDLPVQGRAAEKPVDEKSRVGRKDPGLRPNADKRWRDPTYKGGYDDESDIAELIRLKQKIMDEEGKGDVKKRETKEEITAGLIDLEQRIAGLQQRQAAATGAGWMVPQGVGFRSSGLLYRAPTFAPNGRVFTDLVAFAPGLNTQVADILGVLENEAAADPMDASGTVEDGARDLIDGARAAGWRTLTVPAAGTIPAWKMAFDGSGRYAAERILPSGLKEQIICDGKELLHLYPELGLGSRRTVTRFHRAELTDLVPWALPPAKDLAHGYNLKCAGERIVSLMPRGLKADQSAVIAQLVFAEEGRLEERRLVELPKNKVIRRETYSTDGTVKVLDGDNKEVSKRKLALKAGGAADLDLDTKDLVVLPMPLRTREHVIVQPGAANGDINTMEKAAWMALLASDSATNNVSWVDSIIRVRAVPVGDNRPGFLTLLLSAGYDVNSLPLLANPKTPLGRYIDWLKQAAPATGPKDGDRNGGLLHNLMEVQSITRTWQSMGAPITDKDVARAIKAIREAKSPLFAWAVVMEIQRWPNRSVTAEGGIAKVQRDVLEAACAALKDVPALSYAARYELARHLADNGERAEARKRFVELYEEAFKGGTLPPLDRTFRQALQASGKEPDLFGKLLRETAAQLVKDNRRVAAVTLVWQCWELDVPTLADELLTTALDGITDRDHRMLPTVAAIDYLAQTHQYDRADKLLQGLLSERPFDGYAGLWRMGYQLALQRKQPARAFNCLAQALELEYREMPEWIDLAAVRRDYGALLRHYGEVVQATATLGQKPPADLVAKVVRAADRWRWLDVDGTAASNAAFQSLSGLGDLDTAWDYLLMGSGIQQEGSSWVNLAQTLQQQENFELAERAYAQACIASPGNADLLRARADNLLRAGHAAEGRELLRQAGDAPTLPPAATVPPAPTPPPVEPSKPSEEKPRGEK